MPVVLLIVIAAGTAAALAIGTRRTESAPDRYTAEFGGDPTTIIYQVGGTALTEQVRTLPGVRDARSITFITAFPVTEAGYAFGLNPFAGDDDVMGARLLDGRFVDQSNPAEFTANRAAMEMLDGEVGRTYDIGTYTPAMLTASNPFDEEMPPDGPTLRAKLVGVWTSPSEFDDPTPQLMYSTAFMHDHPEIGVVATLIAAYGEAGVSGDDITEAVRRLPGGEDVYQSPLRLVSDSIRDALDLQTRALWVVTLVTLAAAAVVTAQLVIRHLRSTTGDRLPLLALGYRPRQLMTEAGLIGGGLGLVAGLVASVVAVAGSTLFPLGAARSLEPDQGPRVDVTVLGLTVLALVTVMAGAAALAGRAATASAPRAHKALLADRLADAGAGPSLVHGVRFAVSRRRRGIPPLAFVAGVAVALTGICGALVMGSSLDRATRDAARWGANYDQLFGNQYVPQPGDLVGPVLASPATVERVADLASATVGGLTIEGLDVSVFSSASEVGNWTPVITAGRAPSAPDEIALGRRVARAVDRELGDTVAVASPAGDETALRVVGITVTPDQAGDGAAMTYDGYSAIVPDATKNLLLVNWRGNANEEDVKGFADVAFTPDGALETPGSVNALDRVTTAPYLLAVVLIVLTAGTLLQTLVASVRERRHDLAVLRALGADRGQLRRIVVWESLTIVSLSLVVAVPLGALLGGRLFRLTANDVGVVPTPLVSWLLLGIFATAVLLTAALLAWWPARRAARIGIAVLRRS